MRTKGQVAPLMCLALAGLLCMAALAVDVGSWRVDQRHQQNAADSAAVAGAAELAYPPSTASPSAYITFAQNAASSNGFTNDGSSTIVNVNNPPTTGAYAGDAQAVEVYVKAKRPAFFAGPLGVSNTWVTTRAVAMLVGYGGYCIYALNPNAKPYTLQVTGGYLNSSTCQVIDDGPMDFTGGSITAAGLGVVGAVTHTGGTYGEATPSPALSASDPCQAIPACAYLSNNAPSTVSCANYSGSNGTHVLSQGVYCSLLVSGGSTTLTSGLYVITGQFKQSGGTLTGSGVTFYIATGGSITLTGGTSSLSAPTSGNTANMLFYQVPSNTNTATLTGGGGSSCPSASPVFTGVFYAPGALLDVTGGGSWDPSTVIAGAIEVTGGALTCITIPAGGSPLEHAVLVE